MELYRCFICKGEFNKEDICIPYDRYNFSNICRFCSHDRMFKNLAINYILNTYNLRSGEYSGELLELETIRAKTRFVLRQKDSKYITFKKEDMITTVNNSTELRQALNENLHALLTKKRKLLVAKEVNNTLGKILIDVKMEIMQNALTGNKERISWFENNKSEMRELYGCHVRIKNFKEPELEVSNY